MKYQIAVERSAEKFISRLPHPDKERVLRAIAKFPDDGDIKKMQEDAGEGRSVPAPRR